MAESLLPSIDVNPNKPHDAVVIWLHGLGDSGHGFAPIVEQLNLSQEMAVRFVFPHAPVIPVTINNGYEMRAWYDIKSMDLESRADEAGVRASAEKVKHLIEHEIAQGIPSERIILAGFSQGGVIAIHLATRFEQPLGGLLAMSTYMCAPQKLEAEAHQSNRDIKALMCHGMHDDVVPMTAGANACDVLRSVGYDVEWQEYPMQHNVCMEQIQAISTWIQQRLAR